LEFTALISSLGKHIAGKGRIGGGAQY
jgi:hypothetical protein